jgi:hypothetical protein
MFSPESPPPSKYHHAKPSGVQEEEKSPLVKTILVVLFVIIGVGAIAAMIFFGPKQKQLVCDSNMQGRGASLTSFGSCTRQ